MVKSNLLKGFVYFEVSKNDTRSSMILEILSKMEFNSTIDIIQHCK